MSQNIQRDEDLIVSIREGDRFASERLFKKYWGLLYTAAFKILKDEDDAKDVVQEVFISFFNRINDIEIKTSLSVYLYSATRYKTFDLISKKKSLDAFQASFQRQALESYELDRSFIERETIKEIEKEIQNLPDKMRNVFELSRKAGLSHKEIAELLNISDKTVKKQINNALKVLKPKFYNYFFLIVTAFFKNL